MGALAADAEPVRLRELSRRTGLSPSTTRRILASLCHHRMCEQDEDGAYRLGLTLFELGSRVEGDLDVRSRSLPALKRLAERSSLTTFACVRRDDRAVAIERVDGRYAFSLALSVGGSLPLHAGAASRALLAYLSDEEARELLAQHPPEAFTERTLTTEEEILADMRAVRARGYAISDGDVTPGVAAIGMPVFGHGSGEVPVAAISVAGLVPQVLGDAEEAVREQLRDAAEEISRGLGQGIAGHRPERAVSEGAAA